MHSIFMSAYTVSNNIYSVYYELSTVVKFKKKITYHTVLLLIKALKVGKSFCGSSCINNSRRAKWTQTLDQHQS